MSAMRPRELSAQPGANFPTVHASLSVFGEFDPDDLTELLGLAPSQTVRKGTTRPHRAPVAQDIWTVRTDDAATMDGTTHVEEIIGAVKERTETLRRFCAEHKASLQVSLWATVPQGPFMAVPNLMLDAGILEWFVNSGATFAIDYCLDPPGDATG